MIGPTLSPHNITEKLGGRGVAFKAEDTRAGEKRRAFEIR